MFRDLSCSTYAPRGVGEVKPPIHFHCILHAKRGWVGPDSLQNCVRTKWKAPYITIQSHGLSAGARAHYVTANGGQEWTKSPTPTSDT